MSFISGLYEGELSEVRADRGARWRRRRAAMLLVDLDELAPLARRLKRWGVRLSAKSEIEAELARAGLAHGGRVLALCARGLVAYLCHGADGVLSAVRYGLGDRTWLVPARLHAEAQGLAYAARAHATAETAQLAVDATDGRGGFALAVSFIGRRRKLPFWRRPLASGRALAAGLLPALQAWSAAEPVRDQRLAA